MNIQVRVDDFPQGIPNKRYAKKDLRLLEQLEKKQMPYVIGVVPELVIGSDIEVLKSLKYATIAMHGFNHSIDKWIIPLFEFKGMSEEEIESKLLRGLDVLREFRIEWFIPPFNMFNQALVSVLARYNFKYITGGHETLARMLTGEKIDVQQIDFKGMELICSFIPYYTSNGNFNHIIGLLDTCPKDQQITFHLGGEYIF